MKKVLAFILLVLVFMPAIASAAGKLTVTHKNIVMGDSDSGYFYARIENTGDESVFVDTGKLVVFSKDDDILATESYIYATPNRVKLAPGEYTYAYEFLWNSSLENAEIGDIKFSIGQSDRGTRVERIPCETWFTDEYVYITFTNTTNETRYGYIVAAALYDDQNQLIFVDRNSYDNLGVHPNGTVTVKLYIDSRVRDYINRNKLSVSTSDAIVLYTE